MFYGSSMGGYAALTFSHALPGSIVLAHVPQSTLARDLVPREHRFSEARLEDWSGDFRDAADCRTARAVYVTYDPFYRPDAQHIARLRGDNIVRLKVPAASHRVPDTLSRLGFIKTVFLRAMELDRDFFPSLIRSRRTLASYYIGLRKRTRHPMIAAACLKKAAEIDADDVDLGIELFSEAFAEARYADCIAVFERLGKMPKVSNSKRLLVIAQAARSYIERDRHADAAALARTTFHASTEAVRYYKVMAGVFGDLNDPIAASVMAERAARLAQLRRDTLI